jgi:type III secretion protein L
MGLVTLLNFPDLKLLDRKHLRPTEILAVVKADDLVRQGKQAALQIEEAARQAFEAEKQRGYQAGLEEGRKEAALRLASFAVDNVVILRRLQRSVAETVLRLVEDMLGEVPAERFYAAALDRAITMFRQQAFLILHVSAADEEAARTALDEWVQEAGITVPVTLRVNPELPAFSCMLESEAGVVDASLSVQLDAIRVALERELQELRDPREGAGGGHGQ